MKKSIVIMTNTPYSARDEERFGVNYFIENGFKVRVLDITGYIFKHKSIDISTANYMSFLTEVYTYSKYDDIEVFISQQKDSLFISYVGDMTYEAHRLYSFLSRQGIIFGRIYFGNIPIFQNNKRDIIKKIFSKIILRLLKLYLAKLLYPEFSYSFIQISCKQDLLNMGDHYSPKNTIVIKGHTLDYDFFLKENCTPIIKNNYIVFVDQNIPFHLDAIIRGEIYSDPKTQYYDRLNELFSSIELSSNMKVVIAAHPTSEKYSNEIFWQGRKCFYNNTQSLIKYSSLCLTHFSTAINYAVLYNIPIKFIAMNLQFDKYVYLLSKSFSNNGDNVIDVDSMINFDIFEYDKSLYRLYESQYITIGQKNMSNWEIFIANNPQLQISDASR